jgi:hypothetical protein
MNEHAPHADRRSVGEVAPKSVEGSASTRRRAIDADADVAVDLAALSRNVAARLDAVLASPSAGRADSAHDDDHERAVHAWSRALARPGANEVDRTRQEALATTVLRDVRPGWTIVDGSAHAPREVAGGDVPSSPVVAAPAREATEGRRDPDLVEKRLRETRRRLATRHAVDGGSERGAVRSWGRPTIRRLLIAAAIIGASVFVAILAT